MTASEAKMRVFAVVLAAGRSTRFGGNKLLVRAGGRSLVRRVTETVSDVFAARSLLVTGTGAVEIITAAGDAAGFVIVNERAAEGMGTSIAAGVSAVAHAATAVVLVLADQVLVPPGHLASMVETWSGADDEIVATSFDDAAGPPVLFPRGAFDRLVQLDGDEGARTVLRDPRFTVRTVRCDAAAVDIDTPEDLAKL